MGRCPNAERARYGADAGEGGPSVVAAGVGVGVVLVDEEEELEVDVDEDEVDGDESDCGTKMTIFFTVSAAFLARARTPAGKFGLRAIARSFSSESSNGARRFGSLGALSAAAMIFC